MATLAQLLDKPAPPLNYVSSTSSSSSGHHEMTITKVDLNDDDVEYLRPFSKAKVPTVLDKVVVSSSSSRCSKNKPSSSVKSQSPGSRLSLIATSLPHPRVNQSESALTTSAPGQKVKIKPLPALSPIGRSCSSSTAKDKKSQYNTKATMDKSSIGDEGGDVPCVVSVRSLLSKSSTSRKGKRHEKVEFVGDLDVEFDEPYSPEYQRGVQGEDELEMIEGEVSMSNKKTKNRIKRPLNAFMVWSKVHRRKIMDSDPTVHHSLISKQLGAGWKSLSTAERLPYYAEAKRLSELHSQIYPDYKYQPRKRSKGSSFPQLGFENRHSITSSSDVSTLTSKGEDSLLNVHHNNGSLIRRSLDGSLDLSMKRQPPPPQGMSSKESGLLGRRNSCFSSTTTYSETSDSADSSLELRQPLNMSLKSSGSSSEGNKISQWDRCYGDDSESDEDRLIIDEKDA